MPNTMGPTSGTLPNGLDRADGLSGRIGTPTPDSAVSTANQNGVKQGVSAKIAIEELEDSPTIERGEQATIIHKYRMSWEEGLNQIVQYGRGTVLTDSEGNITKVLTALLEHAKPDHGKLTITCESLSFDTPPDTFSIVESELGVNIIKYPRYFYALSPDETNDSSWETNVQLNQDIIRYLQNYFENTTSQYRNALTFQLQKSVGYPCDLNNDGSITYVGEHGAPTAAGVPVTLGDGSKGYICPIAGTDFAKAAAIEIIQKYWRNEETPYMVGYEMMWTSYYYAAPYLNPGGYVEDAIQEANPPLPDYFYTPIEESRGGYQYSTNYIPGVHTFFDGISTFNPQCFAENGQKGTAIKLSYLRKADRQEEQRTWFKVDRRWFVSAIGFWDPDLYNRNNRPQQASDYNSAAQTIITKQDVSQAKIPTITLSAQTLT